MKKQKKLSLGKIKIAEINKVNSLFGGRTTYYQTSDGPQEPSCRCGDSTDCDTYGDCPTTIKTKSESDVCDGGGDESVKAGGYC